ncbi:hypothetical protein LBMAG53_23540 [Planctomycetota bacterium]|nr:hypothetical protein LBMAG53_23540 [Planctomycetota bacterium]
MPPVPEFDPFTTPLPDGVLVIEASAGTGKTFSLIHAVVRELLCDDRLRPDQVLLVTFTNAATDELGERLRRLIDEVALAGAIFPEKNGAGSAGRLHAACLARRGGDQSGLARRLAEVRLLADQIAVRTIHGFCNDVLTDQAFAAGRPFALELLTDPAAAIDEALGESLRHLREQVPGDHPEVPARLVRSLLSQVGVRIALAPADLADLAQPDPAAASAELARSAAAIAAAWSDCRKHTTGLAIVRGLHWKSGSQLDADGWALIGKALASATVAELTPETWKVLRRLADGEQVYKKDSVNLLSSPLVQALRRFLTAVDGQGRLWRLAVLHHTVHRLRRLLAQRRQRTTDDLLDEVDRALTTHSGLADRLGQRFSLICIDEFQDTDERQWRIFRRCFATAGCRLVLIGDPKQSIYAFRGADVRVFTQAQASASRVGLSTNFRCHPDIQRAVNQIFAGPRAFVDGTRFAPFALTTQPTTWLEGAGASAVDWWFADHPDDDAAIAATAREIRRLLGSGIAVCSQRYPSGRPEAAGGKLHAGDLAVLVSDRFAADRVQQALRAVQVPSVIASNASVLGGEVARELALVVRAILDPGRDRLLRPALATRMWGFSAGGLRRLEDDPRAADGVLNLVRQIHRRWNWRGLSQALAAWCDAVDAWMRLAELPGGDRWLTDLRQLLDLIAAEERTGMAAERIADWLERGDDEADAETTARRLESDDRRVRISTVHASKGLEYPVVFCPLLWADRQRERKKIPELVVPAEPGWSAHLEPELADEAVWRQYRRRELAERSRLLYVALTRAQARLVLVVPSGHLPDEDAGHGQRLAAFYRHTLGTPQGWQILGAAQPADGGQALLHRLFDDSFAKHAGDPPEAELKAYAAAARHLIAGFSHRSLDEVLSQPLAPPARVAASPEIRAAALPTPVAAALSDHWTIASFTRISGHPGRRGDEARLASSDADAADPLPLTGLRGGAALGDCLHDLIERWDPTRPADPHQVQDHLRRHGFAAGSARLERDCDPLIAVTSLLDRLGRTPIPADPAALVLADLSAADRLAEWRFHLTLDRLDPAGLGALVRRHDPQFHQRFCAAFTGFTAPAMHGFLTGSIDLLARHGGKLWVIDWKSNHLGRTWSDYAAPALDAAMTEARYPLQALFYLTALRRWLRTCGDDDPEARIGGARFIFLRGLGGPEPGHGIVRLDPTPALLRALDQDLA